jgi:predicted dehydrogenase
MKFLVIGLGSMGKRRIRCLKTLGYDKIIGFDLREDRRNEANQKYNIETFENLEYIDFSSIYAIIISVPPDLHLEYIKTAIKNKIPAFIEAGVISEHTAEAIKLNEGNNIFLAPSATLLFHPIVKDIKEIIVSEKYGLLTNFSYHSGQYLPDWHPWEDIKDFYVSKRITGGAREIVPFELTWITDVFGFPKEIKGYYSKTMNLSADIEDSYSFNIRFENGIGSVIVDVTSRYATRSLIVNLEKAQIRWDWEDGMMSIYEAERKRWIKYLQPEGKSEIGYNKNIIEEMYIEEIKSFIEGINDMNKYPNTLERDFKVLELLDTIENSDGGFNR